MSDSNKTEKATPRRRQKAREQGQVARSRDFSNILAATAALSVFAWQTPQEVRRWGALLQNAIELSTEQSIAATGPLFLWVAAELARWAAPALLTAFCGALLGGLLQGGLVIAPEALAFKIERFSPAKKLGQLFSLTGLSGMLKSLLPFSAIAYVAVATFRQGWSAISRSANLPFQNSVSLTLQMVFTICWKSALVLVVWAGVDYALTWFKLEGDLKMSREEMRQETEGHGREPRGQDAHAPHAKGAAAEKDARRHGDRDGRDHQSHALRGGAALRRAHRSARGGGQGP